MTSTIVRLTDEGQFHIASSFPGVHDFRVVIESDEREAPWAIERSANGDDWKHVEFFESLDEALDFCVSSVTGTYPTPGYGVELPCGSWISRPGRIKIEDVMAGYGWMFITHLRGFTPKTFSRGTSSAEAEAYFENLTQDTTCVVETVTNCGEEDERTLWIASVMIPVDAFMRLDDIEAHGDLLMEEDGVASTGNFEYFHRANVRPHCATVTDISGLFATATEAAA